MSEPEKRAETAADQVTQLVELLDVETIDVDLYRGARQPGGVGRVFGGQVIAQALQAAQRSVEGKDAHSLHAYFMRPGNEDFPIIYRVVRDYDGGSFANRRVIALQQGMPILNMIASFQRPEDGLSHQADMPDVPGPDDLRSEFDLREEIRERLEQPQVSCFGSVAPLTDGLTILHRGQEQRLAQLLTTEPSVRLSE